MPAITDIVNRFNHKRLDQIDHFRKFPADVQQEIFRQLIGNASGTEWGKTYSYSSITSIKEYQNKVPVQTYEDITPYIERLGNGESDILWPGKIKWFAKSSGTTSSKSKFIPVTRESLDNCHYRAAKDVLAIYTYNNPSSRIFSGKALILGGSHSIDHFSSKALCGDLSAILIQNAPSWVELVRTPKKNIALIEDFEKKLELITRATIKEVFFHGGISFTPYRELYKQLIPGNNMHYMETYNASEGFFGIQDEPSIPDLLLMLDYGIFYEFVPAEKTGEKFPVTYTISEVEKGVNYAMIISANSGLWRYMPGDTIVFTCLQPYRFRISGRTKHFINAFGEEIIIDNAEKALEAACSSTGAIVSEYTAGPVFMDVSSRGCHEWLIEFERNPGDPDLFGDILDRALQSINSDYEAKRYKDINLVKPIIRPVPRGTFHNWLKSKNKLGGQNKVPRLSNTREYIEEIYLIAGIRSDQST
jgi:hypothetical protein